MIMSSTRMGLMPAYLVLGYIVLLSIGVHSFTTTSVKARAGLHMSSEPNFLDKIPKIPNPFSKSFSEQFSPSESEPSASEPPPDSLIGRAKAVIAADLGIQDAGLLDDDFIWIGPLLEKPLGKIDYQAAGRFFNVRSAFPDLDYRAHDFRMDVNDPQTVRCTVRPVGTMRGSLRLRSEIVEPNGMQWRGPPEAISMTFDEATGKLVKLCSGFALDRFVGNTNGLCGVMAAATVAGVPPADWEVYPIPAVISRFFGRPVSPLQEVSAFLAPFPETVMIQLAKGVLSATLAADDPSLLSKDFSFVTPSVGPIDKSKFLESYAAQEFGDFEPEFSHFRVDPFDPNRVWVDVKPIGPGFEGPPQAFSFAFDDEGFCARITTGAVMDPSIGNTGGLAGADGIRYSLGEGTSDIVTRPLPLAIARLKKNILSPITNINADDYRLSSSKPENAAAVAKPAGAKEAPAEEDAAAAQARERILQEKARKEEATKEKEERLRLQKEARQAQAKVTSKKIEEEKPAPDKKQESATKPLFFALKVPTPAADTEVKQRELVLKAQKAAVDKKQLEELKKKELARRQEAENRKAAEDARRADKARLVAEGKKQQAAELEARRKVEQSRLTTEERKRAEEQNRKAAEAESEARRQQLEQQKRAAAEQKVAQVAAQAEDARNQAEARKAVTEQKRQEAEARQAAQAEARRKQIEERKAAAEQKREEAEQKRAEAAEAMRRKAEEVKAAFRQKEASLQKLKGAQERQKEAGVEQSIKAPSTPANMFDFSPFNFAPPKPKASTKARQGLAKAPAGVPTVVAWRKRPDGGVSGKIFGSLNFREGDRVESSPIVEGTIDNGNVVITESGSRYFLSDMSVKEMRQETSKSAPLPKEILNAKPRATIRLTQNAKEREAKAALEAAKKAKPRATFSLSLSKFFGLDEATDNKKEKIIPSSRTSRSPVQRKGPKGVPSISRWKQNKDKSITGFISGSPAFPDGENITTSPIAKGTIKPGELVVTSSGTRYLLQ